MENQVCLKECSAVERGYSERDQLRRSVDRELLEFLPGALEIQDKPPSPIGRWVLWILVLAFLTALTWAVVGRVDIVALAPGKIIPEGHVKVIQPREAGTVRRIHVREGEDVRANQILVSLDPTVSAANQGRLDAELRHTGMELARQKGLLTALESGGEESAVPRLGPTLGADIQEDLLRGQLLAYRMQLAVIDGEITRQDQALRVSGAQIEKLEGIVPLITERAQSLGELVRQKLQGRHAWLEIEQERIAYTQELAVERHGRQGILADIDRLQTERRALEAQFKADLLEQAAESQRRLEALGHELVKARQRSAWQDLRAPVNGTVQQLSIHTIGGVVSPAQPLMVIVPSSGKFEIEATVLNKDIGFVRLNQVAEIKVDTFPFTRYGTLSGRVVDISHDAIQDENQGLVYRARLALDSNRINVDGQWVNLTSGMGVVAEIKTGQRRIIEYILSPVLRYGSESLRER